ncbi:MAG TPA: CRISPR system precrRNA processing endoribonuclease RAMP protein Cas6, partial [Ruminiclostridium sp.]|nr:CRISPR system precrRNA processing endoribonuclease RAMP protein Cas6 [Ruminiclostridium sp.]
MITQIKTQLKMANGSRMAFDFAYDLYSALIRKLDPDFADSLHNGAMRCINHYLKIDRNNPSQATHIVNLLNDEARANILPLMISHENVETPFGVINRGISTVSNISHDDILKAYSVVQIPHRVKLQLVSPTTFKTNGSYALFPSSRLIIQSVMTRFDTLCTGISVEDDNAMLALCEAVKITDYNLHSFQYRLKQIRIPAFLGSVTLTVHDAEPLCRLFYLLTNALPYIGLGIKTTLGMGGVML